MLVVSTASSLIEAELVVHLNTIRSLTTYSQEFQVV